MPFTSSITSSQPPRSPRCPRRRPRLVVSRCFCHEKNRVKGAARRRIYTSPARRATDAARTSRRHALTAAAESGGKPRVLSPTTGEFLARRRASRDLGNCGLRPGIESSSKTPGLKPSDQRQDRHTTGGQQDQSSAASQHHRLMMTRKAACCAYETRPAALLRRQPASTFPPPTRERLLKYE